MKFINNLLSKYDRHMKAAGVIIACLSVGFYSAVQDAAKNASIQAEKTFAVIRMCESTENQSLDVCVKHINAVRDTVATVEWNWEDGREHDAR